MKLAISRGSVRVAAAAAAPSPAVSTSLAGSRPRAAASNSARCGPERPSAPASSRAVSWRAVRFTPRSRSLTDRGDRPAASASSSCVSPASSRSCRSRPPKLSPGCSATGSIAPRQTPSAVHRRTAGHGTDRTLPPAYKRARNTPCDAAHSTCAERPACEQRAHRPRRRCRPPERRAARDPVGDLWLTCVVIVLAGGQRGNRRREPPAPSEQTGDGYDHPPLSRYRVRPRATARPARAGGPAAPGWDTPADRVLAGGGTRRRRPGRDNPRSSDLRADAAQRGGG